MDPAARPKWKTTASRYLVEDRWLKLRADACLTPGGEVLEPWYVLEYPDWVNCLVIDQAEEVVLLHHYRHGAGEYVPEIVGGNVDAGDSPLEAVRRELQEEIGYVPGELYPTGIAYPNPSNQTNKLHAFLAVGGACTEARHKEAGADFSIGKIPFRDFLGSVTDPASATCYQSLHLTSIFFALNFIRKSVTRSAALDRLRERIAEAGSA
jgi:8-oxo-dGTP pyrophosphatase MutT (NUDIX family)